MKQVFFYVPTITQAMRGKSVLLNAGIRAFVSRNSDMRAGEGCSYSIAVVGDDRRAQTLLLQNQIQVTRIGGRGENV